VGAATKEISASNAFENSDLISSTAVEPAILFFSRFALRETIIGVEDGFFSPPVGSCKRNNQIFSEETETSVLPLLLLLPPEAYGD